jgi:hypothetical protein
MAAAIFVVAADCANAQSEDAHRFCDSDAPNVVVFLDLTTPYDEIDREALIQGISQIFESSKDGARLVLRTVEDAFTASDRVADICIPFCPSEGFLSDLLSDCTGGVVINERKRQRHLISAALLKLMQAREELPHSDILRTLFNAAREEYRDGRENMIYIYSDMVENSEYISGKEFFTSSNETLLEKLADDRLVPNLFKAQVQVFGMGRGGSADRTPLAQERLGKVEDFWRLYFTATGATVSLQQNLASTH